jgi:hypothetical protein
LYGDGFAHPLDTVGAHFILKIYGSDRSIDPIIDTLAWVGQDTVLRQSNQWHWVDLTNVGATDTLHFELETTDMGQYGPNTALYFCMDKLMVDNLGTRLAAAKKSASKQKYVEEFSDFLTVATHVAGEAILYNAQGQVALNANLKAGSNKFDTKKLSAGKYTMIHHHRVKHFIKK